MNENKSRVGLLLPVVAAAVTWGCSSTPHKIAEEEISAHWSGEPYDDLLVVGVYEDRAHRVGAESTLVEALKSHGVSATPSFDLLPRLESLDSEQEVARALAGSGHDGLLIVATLDEGYDYDVGDYFATRGIVYLLGGKPGAATNTGSFLAWAASGSYSLYLGLWDAASLKPVWEAETDSQTTESESGDTRALAGFAHQTLRERGLIEGNEKATAAGS